MCDAGKMNVAGQSNGSPILCKVIYPTINLWWLFNPVVYQSALCTLLWSIHHSSKYRHSAFIERYSQADETTIINNTSHPMPHLRSKRILCQTLVGPGVEKSFIACLWQKLSSVRVKCNGCGELFKRAYNQHSSDDSAATMRCSMVVPNRIEVGGLVDGRLFFRIPAHSSSPFPSMALIVLSPRKHHRIDVRSSRVFTPLICHKTVRVHWQTSGWSIEGCWVLCC